MFHLLKCIVTSMKHREPEAFYLSLHTTQCSTEDLGMFPHVLGFFVLSKPTTRANKCMKPQNDSLKQGKTHIMHSLVTKVFGNQLKFVLC